MSASVALVSGKEIARYGFPNGHPFGTDRHDHFMAELRRQGLDARVQALRPRLASDDELLSFQHREYVERVRRLSIQGEGYLDAGDTPAFPGVFEAASAVVGASLVAAEAIMSGRVNRAFVPIAGLHHAGRGHAAGFCVFNDIGVVIEQLRHRHGLARIAYVDIDAHHGDGVYYAYEDDPDLCFADIHEDGRLLYPGTGAASEEGAGAALGTKLNIPMPAGASDTQFMKAWERVEGHLEKSESQFIILQCGADSLAGDPITHLSFSEHAHGHAATRLCEIAASWGHGRVLALGGGGYNRQNLARAWTRVVAALLDAT